MDLIKINTSLGNTSEVFVGESYLRLESYLPHDRVVVIIDDNVYGFYSSFFSKFNCVKIHANEKLKTFETVEHIISRFIELKIDRSYFVVGVGGGIVCDISGFVASVYMRGLAFGFVSTSLLSQVDASVGGKNGVNFHSLKNMIGVFNQPKFVICDVEMLDTLPDEELIGGMAEVVKIALITDEAMFDFIENNVSAILKRDRKALEQLILKSVQHKADIVARDEREKGERRLLNLGHTFAHAIEKALDINHGFAVSVGIVYAARLSHVLGLISTSELERIKNVLALLGLPLFVDIEPKFLMRFIDNDKKKQGDEIDCILIEKIGKAGERRMSINELDDLMCRLRS